MIWRSPWGSEGGREGKAWRWGGREGGREEEEEEMAMLPTRCGKDRVAMRRRGWAGLDEVVEGGVEVEEEGVAAEVEVEEVVEMVGMEEEEEGVVVVVAVVVFEVVFVVVEGGSDGQRAKRRIWFWAATTQKGPREGSLPA